jgi:pimeloyl-ACP methyl ester carboxylesterase
MGGEESFETIDGCRIKLMRGGAGEPLLFLHGAGGARVWAPFMETLSQSFDLIVPEHPGYGASDMPQWLDNVGDLAYFYLDLIDKLGLDRVNLVGTSIGGWIAAEIAVRNDTKLKSLVLSAPAGIHVKGLQKGDIFLWSPEQYARNLFHDQKMAEAWLARPVGEDEQLAAMKNNLATARLAWQPRLYDPDLHKWLHRVSVPTLILWGDDDKVIPPGYGPAYQKLIPGSRLEVIKDSGHLPQIEKAKEWTGKVTGFIREVAR